MIIVRTLRRDIARYNKNDDMVRNMFSIYWANNKCVQNSVKTTFMPNKNKHISNTFSIYSKLKWLLATDWDRSQTSTNSTSCATNQPTVKASVVFYNIPLIYNNIFLFKHIRHYCAIS